MRVFSLACFCVCLTLAGGHRDGAQAQSDAGAVLLPPASIPQSRSRQATPRPNFRAPNPVSRPLIEDQAALDTLDESARVLPPEPTPAPAQTDSEPANMEPSDQAPTNPATSVDATNRLATSGQDIPRVDRNQPNVTPPNLTPPNPMPRSALTFHTLAYGEAETEPNDQDDENSIALPTANPVPEPVIDLACHQTLTALGAMFEPRGRVEGEGQCGIDDAVAVRAIGDITLQPAALISCPTAATFTAFVQQTITPQAAQIMGSQPSTIYVAASYACRGRNNVPGARMSEHAFGRAVDVRALDLEDGQSWHVQPHEETSEEPAARFQAALRGEACGPFNTVLGPGSDGHHSDHLHFDAARRSSSYCR